MVEDKEYKTKDDKSGIQAKATKRKRKTEMFVFF